MRRLATGVLLISALCLAAVACAAGDEKPVAKKPTSSADVVTVTAVPAATTAKAGEKITFDVKVAIAPHWHLYAHSYAEDPESMYIGIDVLADETFPLTGLKTVYPEAVKGTFLGEDVMMHEGNLVLKVTATVPADVEKGELELPLALTVQACDDKICLRPSDVPIKVTVTVS